MIHLCVKPRGLGWGELLAPLPALALAVGAPVGAQAAPAAPRPDAALVLQTASSGHRPLLSALAAPGAPRAFQAPALTNTAPPPPTAAGILDVIDTHNKELKDFVDRGVFNEIWVPALATKDVAVYLDDHLTELKPETREPAQAAVARLVRACWLLDAVGDLGNRPQIVDAYTKYTQALTDVHSFFPGK
jgi:hypothetical protein